MWGDRIVSNGGRLELERSNGPNYIDFHPNQPFNLRSYDGVSSGSQAQTRMTIATSGRIGIGTTNPIYPLHVVGNTAPNVHTFYSYTHQAAHTNSQYNHDVSIWCDRVGCQYIIWWSDLRIKNDIVIINDDKALNQVNSIQTYEYNYIDPERKKEQKTIGFIAQEVKKVVPNAVSIQNEFVPDEMRPIDNPQWSQFTDLSGNNKFKLEINNIDFSGNFTGKCKFYVSNDPSGNDEVCKEVIVEDDKKNFIFDESWNTVFFYGKEVTDFHTLDKAQIFALHHSAIQELSRKNDALQTENNELRSRLEALESAVLALQNNN